ncbi:hypothetical protein [Prosthecobacter sp.]|jgi:hypothetical protein|uniref:hypothetical protein n=1 Tax=Prosthecobacter sp. TaxID=1965333 RepID=UPI0037836B5F
MRRSIVLICIVICLIALWLMQTAFQPKEPVPVSKIPNVPQTSLSAPTPPKAEKPPAARKLLQITSKGKIRLKPGESAVLGYWEIAPGMNGMAIVTPETTPEGHVKMTSKLLHLSDEAVSDAEAKDLFPDIFDFENYSAIAPERLRGLQSALQSTRGVDMLTTPTVVMLPGQHASISIGNSNESMLSLSLQADAVADDGGYDLSLELQRQE